MRFLLICLLTIAPVFAKSKIYNKKKILDHNIAQEYPEKRNLDFVIVVPCYNFSPFLEETLSSIAIQEYRNFRVIFIDDCSTDDTVDKAKHLVQEYNLSDKVSWVFNTVNQGILHNHYHAIHSCKLDEVIVCLDGDDALYDKHVLHKLNKIYNNPEVWMTYGSYEVFPNPGLCLARSFSFRMMKKMNFRKPDWCFSHLKTFYAALFHKICKEDLMKDGKFLKVAGDVAFMYPMLEMSRMHAFFIKEPMYRYRRHAANEDILYGSEQWDTYLYLKENKSYTRLKNLFN